MPPEDPRSRLPGRAEHPARDPSAGSPTGANRFESPTPSADDPDPAANGARPDPAAGGARPGAVADADRAERAADADHSGTPLDTAGAEPALDVGHAEPERGDAGPAEPELDMARPGPAADTVGSAFGADHPEPELDMTRPGRPELSALEVQTAEIPATAGAYGFEHPGVGGTAAGYGDAAPLSTEERAELERLRATAVTEPPHRAARASRWIGAVVVLVVAALLASVAVIGTYVRNQVLDTNTYVSTVTPLMQQPSVQEAVAHRLSDEIVTATNLQGLANSLARNLVSRGAPARIEDFVGPLIGGITSFLYQRILPLLATPQFQAIWVNLNRLAHQGVVTALTGGQGQVIKTGTTTVSIDLGALLTAAKNALVAQGFGFASKIPTVSIPYTLVQSNKLPQIRTYTRILDTVGTWLPYVVLVLLIAGVLIAPDRRRALVVGSIMVAAIGLLMLAVLAFFRGYYRDHLPPTVSQPAATAAYDIVLRYLKDAFQTLVLVTLVLALVGWLAGPARPAVWFRREVNKGFGYVAGQLSRLGAWSLPVGRALSPARHAIKIGVVVFALVLYLAVVQPTVGSALWWIFGVLVLLGAVEIFSRVSGGRAPAPA